MNPGIPPLSTKRMAETAVSVEVVSVVYSSEMWS